MRLARTRNTRIVLGVGFIALLVVIVAAVFVVKAIGESDERLPEITAYAYGETITVGPAKYCSLDLKECTLGEVANLNVPAGQSLQLSLPKEIADAPWRLVTEYQDSDGNLVQEGRRYEPGEADAVTVVSDPLPGRRLNVVEIQLPSTVLEGDGLLARAYWSIQTT